MADPDILLELFKAYLDDLGRLGERQQNSRSFYLSIISALFVFLSFAGSSNNQVIQIPKAAHAITGLVGIVISAAWFEHMRSFEKLFEAKLEILRSVERKLNAHLFSLEEEQLHVRNYRHITYIDSVAPVAFVVLFAGLIYFA